MTIKTDSESDFVPLNANNNNSNDELTKDDFKLLKEFINPLYLTRKCIKDINIQFCENSSLQLNDFLKSDLAQLISTSIISTDHKDLIGMIIYIYI